jgi:hypothetical protein
MKLAINSCDGIYDSLDVRFTKKCDNHCPFCIEKNGVDSFGLPDVAAMIESTLKSGIKDILILGGEPFLYPNKLLKYIYGIRDYVNKIYITTSLPNTFNQYPILCDMIVDEIDGLNVSVLDATFYEFNNQLLKTDSNHNRLKLLKDLLDIYSDKIRVSLNIYKGGIDSFGKLMLSVWDLERMGCKHIKINELQHNSELYISYQEIDSNPIINLKSPYAFGCQTNILLPLVSKAEIILKRSCFKVEESQNASIWDLLKAFTTLIYKKKNNFKVLYENGLLTNGWINDKIN